MLSSCSTFNNIQSGINPGHNKVLYGIDVSHYQGHIDWKKIKNTDISFVYIKVSEGKHLRDKQFSRNWSESSKTKLIRGGYHFFEPKEDAAKQAHLFLKSIRNNGGYKRALPPVLDLEVIRGVSRLELIKGINIWLRIVEDELKCKPIIYTDYSFWNKYLDGEFNHYRLWLAEYANEPHSLKTRKTEIFWQYKQNSTIEGISTKVDKNKFMGTIYELEKLLCKENNYGI